MVKLVLFDIDGTLRDERSGISEKTLIALKECRKLGIRLGICSGRTVGVIPQEVFEIGFEVVISGGGNVITVMDKVLKEVYFQKDLVKELQIKFANYPYTIETPDCIYMNSKATQLLKAMNKQKGIIDFENEPIKYEVNIQDFKEEMNVSKVCLWSKKSLKMELDKLSDKIDFAQIKEDEQECYYEIINKNCHKGQAIVEVIQALSLNKNEVMCFGDGDNDIEMFKECGLAIAMANSTKELIKYADAVCESAKDDGIYQELIRRRIIC